MSEPVNRKVAFLGYAIIIVMLLGISELSSAFLPQLVEIAGHNAGLSFDTPPRITREQHDLGYSRPGGWLALSAQRRERAFGRFRGTSEPGFSFPW